MNTNETFEAALDRFVATVQAVVNDHYAQNLPGSTPDRILVDPNGQKYVRIVRATGLGRAAYCFVERATGAVLKCDGWKRPAKGVRGSIYAADYQGYGVTVYGAVYR